MFDNTKEYIVVSATALASGGALTILKQFIKHASCDDNNYIIFASAGLSLPESENIIYIENKPKGWLQRIYWDWYGCKRFLINKKISIKKIICLQNSTLNVPNDQIVYLHQPIPFSKIESFLNHISIDNLKLFLYKQFYSYFIFKFINKKTIFIVQTEWMKKGVLEHCPHIDDSQIIILKPDIKVFSDTNVADQLYIRGNTFLYPATPLSYKNHFVILKAMLILRKKYAFDDFKFQVTFNRGQFKRFDEYVLNNGLRKNVEYLGVLSYSELQGKYQSAKLVVFPSYIESYGLPLIEAACLGKKIISSDLPYSRDVLRGYDGVEYVKYSDEDEWAHAIFNVMNKRSKIAFRPYENDERSSWPQFFEILK